MQLLHCKRLLECSVASDALETFIGTPPPYAILSHTWGKEEVTARDLARADVSQLAGFKKIKYCCEQALQNGLEYAWVDTCCIDKTSSAELSEAINSMFRWYLNAKVCYAYLEDVDSEDFDSGAPIDSLGASRWFTRGWTIQELLAPDNVIFYSSSWGRLGTKAELVETLSHITKINTYYLGPGVVLRLKSSCIAQKMSWAAKRKTTRVEDMAYCLLGLLDISMPLLYGEGARAFTRLQEELLKQYHDHSIFAWGLSGSGRAGGLLAASPADFQGCEEISVFGGRTEAPAPTRIPRGVKLQTILQLRRASASDFIKKENLDKSYYEKNCGTFLEYAILNCHELGSQRFLALPLRSFHAEDMSLRCWRDKGPVEFVEIDKTRSAGSYAPLVAPTPHRIALISVMDDSDFESFHPSSVSSLYMYDTEYRRFMGREPHVSHDLVRIDMHFELMTCPFELTEVLPEPCWYPPNLIDMHPSHSSWRFKRRGDAKYLKLELTRGRPSPSPGEAIVVRLKHERRFNASIFNFWSSDYPASGPREPPELTHAAVVISSDWDLRKVLDMEDSLDWKQTTDSEGLSFRVYAHCAPFDVQFLVRPRSDVSDWGWERQVVEVLAIPGPPLDLLS
ncbi:heterokaryon incompatibility protein-domain-containing protein [Podospora appendiculata]|uniref:Heterokaryon incompatibility protein-domain-containing protein n=1 Tax=Podospora appendiculata TaxID=314037 RepID=A0AAE0WYY1_9PEZI|nr:heterokaryon incompatibility protein-domain-containing protein [Podospora appendiculata]